MYLDDMRVFGAAILTSMIIGTMAQAENLMTPTCIDDYFPVEEVRFFEETGAVEVDIRNDSLYQIGAYQLEFAIRGQNELELVLDRLPSYAVKQFISPNETRTHRIFIRDLNFDGMFLDLFTIDAHLIDVTLVQEFSLDRKNLPPPLVPTSLWQCDSEIQNWISPN